MAILSIKSKKKILLIIGLIASMFFCGRFLTPSEATIPAGIACSNCHTMHYSQNGTQPSSWGASGPYDMLLVNDCVGCHSSTSSATVVGTPPTPIVFNTLAPTTPLAGGNFYYLMNGPTYGHNPVDITGYPAETLTEPPGAYHSGQVSSGELTCAGNNGCHGIRDTSGPSGIAAMVGGHHDPDTNNWKDGTTLGKSYRFLNGVTGYENNGTYPWQNFDASNHNEYSGGTPLNLAGCASSECHYETNKVKPANGTISGFCGTCHGNFHSQQGVGTSSPFTRHPTDVTFSTSSEYTAFFNNGYDINAPVARTTQVSVISSSISAADEVMCLSCHVAHASPYYKMLRWDYKSWPASGTNGCAICHTSMN